MSFSELVKSIDDIGFILCIAVLVVTVFVVELLKILIEKIRKKNTVIKTLTVKNEDDNSQEKQARYFNNGKVYKKLIYVYQTMSFLIAFIGIGLVLYFYSNVTNISQLCVLSLVIALGVAKVYEIYEQYGIRGLFRWISCKLFASNDNIADTIVDNKELAIEELKALVNNTSNEVKSDLPNYNINEDEIIKLVALLKGKSPEIVKVIFDNIK